MSEQKPVPEDLLGGYATGTLSAEERKRLFEAALKDQALFNALAEDEVLRQVLEDPKARRQLLAVLPDPKRKVVPLWRRPAMLGAAAGLLMVLATVVQLRKHPGSPLPQREPLKGDIQPSAPSATPGASLKVPAAKAQSTAPSAAPAPMVTQAELKEAPAAAAAAAPAAPAAPPLAPRAAGSEEAAKGMADVARSETREREVAANASEPRPVLAGSPAGAGAAPSASMGAVAKDEASALMEARKAKKAARPAEVPAGPPLRACHVEKLEGKRYRILAVRAAETHLYVLARQGTTSIWILPVQEIQRADGSIESRLEFESVPGQMIDVYALDRPVAKPQALGDAASGQWKRITMP